MKPQLIDIDYSYNNLKKYPKDELIALIWRNRSYIKQLENALDEAVGLLDNHMDCEKCPFPLDYEKARLKIARNI